MVDLNPSSWMGASEQGVAKRYGAAEKPCEPPDRPEREPERLLASPERQRNHLGDEAERENRAEYGRDDQGGVQAASLAVRAMGPTNGPVMVANVVRITGR